MSKADDIQTAINRASLMMQVDNDVARAIQKAEIHPDLASVIMTLHHQNHAMDEEIKQLRKNMLMLAQVVNDGAEYTAQMMELVGDLRKRVGAENMNPEE